MHTCRAESHTCKPSLVRRAQVMSAQEVSFSVSRHCFATDRQAFLTQTRDDVGAVEHQHDKEHRQQQRNHGTEREIPTTTETSAKNNSHWVTMADFQEDDSHYYYGAPEVEEDERYRHQPLSHHYHHHDPSPESHFYHQNQSTPPLEENLLTRFLMLFNTRGALIAVVISIGVILFTHHKGRLQKELCAKPTNEQTAIVC